MTQRFLWWNLEPVYALMIAGGRSSVRHVRLAISVLSVALFSLQMVGCSGCEDRAVSSSRVGSVEVSVRHRICGSVGGYAVRIAPPNADLSGRADEFEPFIFTCNCFSENGPPPVAVTMEPGAVLVVRYDTATLWRIDKQRPTHGAFRLRYEPYTSAPR